MAVLHITYKYDPERSKADYDRFCRVIKSYPWTRLSESNWVISSDESAKAVWQKVRRYIDPSDYLVMLSLEEPSSWSPQDQAALKWLLSKP